jgi:hypothetical protein
MRARLRLVGTLTALLATLSLCACACSRPTPTPPATSAASETSTAGAEQTGTIDDAPPENETAAQAAARLFPEVLETASYEVDDPGLLAGSKPGPPVPTSRTYSTNRPTLIRWELPSDARRVSGNMFAAMRSVPASKEVLLVPVTRGGGTIGEFPLRRDTDGYWATTGIASGSLPGGEIASLESATRRLRSVLGADAEVRATVFLPSGLTFAVGDRKGREAAVFLSLIAYGTGISSYKGRLPDRGELFTSSQLQQLYRNANAKQPPARNEPGGLD